MNQSDLFRSGPEDRAKVSADDGGASDTCRIWWGDGGIVIAAPPRPEPREWLREALVRFRAYLERPDLVEYDDDTGYWFVGTVYAVRAQLLCQRLFESVSMVRPHGTVELPGDGDAVKGKDV